MSSSEVVFVKSRLDKCSAAPLIESSTAECLTLHHASVFMCVDETDSEKPEEAGGLIAPLSLSAVIAQRGKLLHVTPPSSQRGRTAPGHEPEGREKETPFCY